MSRTKFGRSINRRTALKTIAASGAAVIGVGSSSGAAAASPEDTYTGVDASRTSDNIGDGYFEHNIGSALKCTDADVGDGTTNFTFVIGGNGVVLNEDGEMPITEAEGYEDSHPRIDHRGNVGEQGVILEQQYGDFEFGPFSSTKRFAPSDPYANQTEVDPGDVGTVLGATFTALGATSAGYALTAAQLGRLLIGFTIDGNEDDVRDLTHSYGRGPTGFLRGGHGIKFDVSVPPSSSGGLITAKSAFGYSEVTYDIQVDHDGYSVYPGGESGGG